MDLLFLFVSCKMFGIQLLSGKTSSKKLKVIGGDCLSLSDAKRERETKRETEQGNPSWVHGAALGIQELSSKSRA